MEESAVEERRRESVSVFNANWEMLGSMWEGMPVEERGISRSGNETDGEMAVVGREEGGAVEEGNGMPFCHERENNDVIFRSHGSSLLFWFDFVLLGIQ